MLWPCSGWGLPSRRGHPHRWCALTAPFHPYRPHGSAVCSLWHCPAGCPGLPLTTTLLCGVRTFLGVRRTSALAVPYAAAARPTRSRIKDSPWGEDDCRGTRAPSRWVSVPSRRVLAPARRVSAPSRRVSAPSRRVWVSAQVCGLVDRTHYGTAVGVELSHRYRREVQMQPEQQLRTHIEGMAQ